MINLSIIIPVYKVEHYLETCLSCIVEQCLTNYEILLVDDCSPDGCGAICDEWAERYKEIRVIHNTNNMGLSMARNVALDEAQGTYVTFVDSDDYTAIASLGANMKYMLEDSHIDVVEYPIYVDYGSCKAYKYIPGDCERITYIDWIKKGGYLHSYACNKIFKRSLWNGIRFPQGRLFEDLFTIPDVMRRAKVIMQSNNGMYYYCNRKGSISTQVTEHSLNELLDAHLNLYQKLLKENLLTQDDLDDFYLHMCNPQIVLLQNEGTLRVPSRTFTLKRALITPRPLTYRLKALMKALCGQHYCKVMSKIRKWLML